MDGDVMEIRCTKWVGQRKLKLDKGTRDALADYCRDRWPHHTAKMAAREFGLSVDEARGVVDARTSFRTYDKIKKAGGWPVIFAVEAAVIGQGVDQFLSELRASHHAHEPRVAALAGDLWTSSPPRRPDPSDLAESQGDWRGADRRRVGKG
jgi:hypothetical protein